MKSILENNNPKLAVIGGGSWATAIVKLLTKNGKRVGWYMRNVNAIEHIREHGHHPNYLPAVELNNSMMDISNDINKVVEDADILIFAIPSAYFMDEVAKITVSYQNKLIISAVKGFVSDDNLTIAEYFHNIHSIPYDKIGVISGPCHAEEVSRERLSYLTISSKHQDVAEYLCNLFKNYYVNTIPGTDIYGVEYAAALKNIYAIAAGICNGLNYGDNFMAVLISNAFNEMKNFINITHPDKVRVTSQSAYLGDLLVTCYSQFSRNRTFGVMLGKAYPVRSAQLEMKQVVEGYYASKAIHDINKKYKMEMPIADAIYSILHEGRYAEGVMKVLRGNLK